FQIARVPAIGMFPPVAIRAGKNQGHHAELNDDTVEQTRQKAAGGDHLPAEEKRDEHDQLDRAGDPQVKEQNAKVEGKQRRTNDLAAEREVTLVFAEAAGNNQRMTVLLEDGLDLGVGQRASQAGLLIFDLRVKVLGQFVDDVISLSLGEAAAD